MFLCSSCQKGKKVFSIHESTVKLEESDFFKAPTWIIKATVDSIEKEYFTNPNGEEVDLAGIPYDNAFVTLYNLTVSKCYKGNWESNTLQLKILNGKGMSPNLYLYGKDKDYILAEEPQKFFLDVGKEYILGVAYVPKGSSVYEGEEQYLLRYGDCWCFEKNDTGIYVNKNNEINHMEFESETLMNLIEEYKN
jgi:hypothetical protein